MKIFIAIDSFKGCLASDSLNHIVAEQLRLLDPQIEISTCTMADGGEGSLSVPGSMPDSAGTGD